MVGCWTKGIRDNTCELLISFQKVICENPIYWPIGESSIPGFSRVSQCISKLVMIS